MGRRSADTVSPVAAGLRLFFIPGEPPSPIEAPSGCRFHPRCPDVIPGRCDIKQPQIIAVDKSHFTACHLYS
ncbi:MAG: hypothetical protein KAI14_04575 [Dehalococcoidales bacterium]|nr:hypothetical protein [Dehalococcoidales bacterium]